MMPKSGRALFILSLMLVFANPISVFAKYDICIPSKCVTTEVCFKAQLIDRNMVKKVLYITDDELFFIKENTDKRTVFGFINLDKLDAELFSVVNNGERDLDPQIILTHNEVEYFAPESLVFLNEDKSVISIVDYSSHEYGCPLAYDRIHLKNGYSVKIPAEDLFPSIFTLQNPKVLVGCKYMLITGHTPAIPHLSKSGRDLNFDAYDQRYYSVVVNKDLKIIKEVQHSKNFNGFQYGSFNDYGFVLSRYGIKKDLQDNSNYFPVSIFDINKEIVTELFNLPIEFGDKRKEGSNVIKIDNNNKMVFFCDGLDSNSFYHQYGITSPGVKEPVSMCGTRLKVLFSNENNNYIAKDIVKNEYLMLINGEEYKLNSFMNPRFGEYIVEVIAFNNHGDVVVEAGNCFGAKRLVLLKRICV